MPPLLRVSLQSNGLPVGVWINDIRVLFRPSTALGSVTAVVNSMLVSGINQLRVSPLPLPASGVDAGNTFSVSASGRRESAERQKHETTFSYSHTGMVGTAWTHNDHFEWKDAVPEWTWQRADILSSADFPAARRKYDEIADHLRRRDDSAFLDEYSLRFAETELATDSPSGSMRGYYQALLTRGFGDAGSHVSVVSEGAGRMQLVGGGRLVQLEQLDGKAGLTIEYLQSGKPDRILLPLLVGRVNGKWMVMR